MGKCDACQQLVGMKISPTTMENRVFSQLKIGYIMTATPPMSPYLTEFKSKSCPSIHSSQDLKVQSKMNGKRKRFMIQTAEFYFAFKKNKIMLFV